MHKSDSQPSSKSITPFEWRLYAEQHTPNARPAASDNRVSSRHHRMSAASRTERILANRWGSPYSKAGSL